MHDESNSQDQNPMIISNASLKKEYYKANAMKHSLRNQIAELRYSYELLVEEVRSTEINYIEFLENTGENIILQLIENNMQTPSFNDGFSLRSQLISTQQQLAMKE